MTTSEKHIPELTLHAFLDGELEGAAEERVEAHLAVCASCQERLAAWQRLFGVVEQLPDVTPGRDLASRIVAEAGRQKAPGWLRPLLVGEAALASLLLIWLWPFVQPLLTMTTAAIQSWVQRLPEPGLNSWVGPAELLGWLQQIDLPTLPIALPTFAWPLVVAVFALWMLGNGLLLKRRGGVTHG